MLALSLATDRICCMSSAGLCCTAAPACMWGLLAGLPSMGLANRESAAERFLLLASAFVMFERSMFELLPMMYGFPVKEAEGISKPAPAL